MQTEWVQVRITGQPFITLPPPGPTDTWLTEADGGMQETDLFHQIKKKRGSSSLILSEFSQAYLFALSLSSLFWELAKYALSREVRLLSLAHAGKYFKQTLATPSTFPLLCEKHKLTSKHFIKIIDGSLTANSRIIWFCFFWVAGMTETK